MTFWSYSFFARNNWSNIALFILKYRSSPFKAHRHYFFLRNLAPFLILCLFSYCVWVRKILMAYCSYICFVLPRENNARGSIEDSSPQCSNGHVQTLCLFWFEFLQLSACVLRCRRRLIGTFLYCSFCTGTLHPGELPFVVVGKRHTVGDNWLVSHTCSHFAHRQTTTQAGPS